jgi:hypothetical protein
MRVARAGKLLGSIALSSLIIAGAVAPAQAVTSAPQVDFEFEDSLTDASGGSTLTVAPACPADPCNATSGFGINGGDKYWEWSSTDNRGGGFTVDTRASLGDSYTIMLKFSFDQMTSWRKIIDFQNRSSDNGFYIYNGLIQEYPLGDGVTNFSPGDEITLMVTRDSASKLFTVYVYDGTNFTLDLQVTDTNDDAIPAASPVHSGGTRLGFFHDDTDTSSEATSSGRVSFIRMWSATALTSTQLQAEAENSVRLPESSSESESGSETNENLADTGANSLPVELFSLGALLVGAAFLSLRKRFSSR